MYDNDFTLTRQGGGSGWEGSVEVAGFIHYHNTITIPNDENWIVQGIVDPVSGLPSSLAGRLKSGTAVDRSHANIVLRHLSPRSGSSRRPLIRAPRIPARPAASARSRTSPPSVKAAATTSSARTESRAPHASRARSRTRRTRSACHADQDSTVRSDSAPSAPPERPAWTTPRAAPRARRGPTAPPRSSGQ